MNKWLVFDFIHPCYLFTSRSRSRSRSSSSSSSKGYIVSII